MNNRNRIAAEFREKQKKEPTQEQKDLVTLNNMYRAFKVYLTRLMKKKTNRTQEEVRKAVGEFVDLIATCWLRYSPIWLRCSPISPFLQIRHRHRWKAEEQIIRQGLLACRT